VSKLYAVSDLHVGSPDNRQAVAGLAARPEDWLIVAGDVGERFEDVRWAIERLRDRFQKVIWVPGNHELWTLPGDPHHTRGEEPWLVLTGDALLVGDAGRPDLHAGGEHSMEEMARLLYQSLTERLLTLPDHLVLYPAHYSGSVCGRGLSANPISTIGFERRHNAALRSGSEDEFVTALLRDIPPAPERQAEIVQANRSGRPVAEIA